MKEFWFISVTYFSLFFLFHIHVFSNNQVEGHRCGGIHSQFSSLTNPGAHTQPIMHIKLQFTPSL